MDIRPAALSLHDNRAPGAERINEAARQLESQFARMMIKSMRDASFGDSLFPGENQLFRDMYDDKLAQTLTQGRGLGLQATIARQLGGGQPDTTTPAAQAQVGGLQRQQALRAYQAQLPGSAPADDTVAAAQAAALAPLALALGSLDGRDSANLHAGLSSAPSIDDAVNPLDLIAQARGDWSRSADRWSQPAVAPGEVAAARQAAASLGSHTPEAFVARIWPEARRAASELGVDPRALVAQAALETAWGKRLPTHADGSSANNLFGIKATGWRGRSVTTGTHEYVAGVRQEQNASFRAYDSIGESFSDYVRLLKSNQRYAGALAAGTDVGGFARGLQRGGYATDPAYADKIAAIAEGSTVARALAAIDRAQPQTSMAGPLARHR